MTDPAPANHLTNLPSVDELLRSQPLRSIAAVAGEAHATRLARTAIAELRSVLADSREQKLRSRTELLEVLESDIRHRWRSERFGRAQKVINATGVIIHTNLGRAPLSEIARSSLLDSAAGYCNLEYDIESGKRGRRGGKVEDLVAELTGAESALIVNNCAAAAFLVLSVLAAGGEVIVSRGELVEIGGDFRVPDVLVRSGARLREVGTTNRTKLSDYERAIGEDTRLILSVHPSNYRIVGFTARPEVSELAGLAQRHGIPYFEDIGSGALVGLSQYGVTGEPLVAESIKAGVDVVAFSGDKLLGGPQAGVIAGRSAIIDRIRRDPLYRVLRSDKLTYSALETTLEIYRRGTYLEDIPVLKMLSLSEKQLSKRADSFARRLRSRVKDQNLDVTLENGRSACGGGSAPTAELPTRLVALTSESLSSKRLEHCLRTAEPPVIARIEDNKVLLDLRTVPESDEQHLIDIIATVR